VPKTNLGVPSPYFIYRLERGRVRRPEDIDMPMFNSHATDNPAANEVRRRGSMANALPAGYHRAK
jgi:hypothetical protein